MELPEQSLKAYLNQKRLISSVESSLKITQFTNGFSNLTYWLMIEDKDYVLRRAPVGATKRGHDMSREFNVLKALHSSFGKVPQVYCYCGEDSVIGAPFYIMEKVDGIILTYAEANQRKISAEGFRHVSKTWLNVYVDLHQIDYKAVGLEDLGKPDGYVKRQVITWGKQYEKAKTSDIQEAEKVISWMEKNQPMVYDHSLIHNDYKYDNVVFEDASWQNIKAVLDWEMCTLGDPLMDLGTSLAYWTTSEDDMFLKQGIPSPTMFEGNPSRLDIVNAYALKSGRAINNLTFYYVYGLYKLAVIAQQIYYRYNKGLTKNPKFAQLDKATKYLMVRAWHVIQNGKI